MGVERVDGAADPRVVAYRNVRDADLLRTRNVFAAEGRLVVRRVLEDGRFAVESVLVNEAALRDLAEPLARLERSVPVLVCPPEALLDLTGFNLHRGCLALVRRPVTPTCDALIAGARTLVALDDVANADNVGGVFRNAAAFGVDGALVSRTSCDPLYRKAIRTSMGAVLQVPFARCDGDLAAALTAARAAGFAVVALTPRAPSEPLDEVAARIGGERVVLVVGAEDAGVSAAVEAAADYRARIPIADRVDSLNVAVAAGIAMDRLRAARSREDTPSSR